MRIRGQVIVLRLLTYVNSLSALALKARAATGKDSALLVIIHMTDAKTFPPKKEASVA
jgi:hypothetical protein